MIPMHRFLLFVGAGLAWGGSLQASTVDFTPRPYDYLADGGVFHGFKFVHGKERILYIPPPGWTCSGNASTASLRPPEGASSARAEITHTEGTPLLPSWDQDGINALIQHAQALLPPLAQEVQIADVRKNPLQVDGHETVLLVFTGRLFAQNYKFFVMLLPLAEEQFGFVLYAEKKEYEAAATAFMGSLYSVRWEKPSP